MPKVTEEYRESRRLEIAQAALRCFQRKGFKGTSMADIIAESGLSAGAIYGHFTNKNELVAVAVQSVVLTRWASIDALTEAEPVPLPHEAIRIFLRGVNADIEDFGILVQIWAESVTDPLLLTSAVEAIHGFRTLFARYLTRWYQKERGLPVAEANERALRYAPLFVGVCQGFIVQSAVMVDFDAESYLESLDAIIPS